MADPIVPPAEIDNLSRLRETGCRATRSVLSL